MNKFWIIPFLLLMIVSIAAVFVPETDPVGLKENLPINSGDTAWMLAATAFVLLMTPGLAFFYGGMVSAKNVVSTMLQSFICMGVVSLLWISVGFSLAFGDDMPIFGISGLIGDPTQFAFFKGVGALPNPAIYPTVPFVVFALFQLMFAIITPALITGSFAERIRFSGYLLLITLFSLFIYSPLAHMAWHADGLLFKMGVLDFAGGTVVHISAGLAALVGAIVLKKRKTHGISHNPANVAYVLLGTGLLWFGWFGFNAGSAVAANGVAAIAFGNTNTAAAAAALAWVFFDAIRGRKISAMNACIGAVVGLVAITPGAGYVTIPSSIFIGTFSAIISNLVVSWKGKTALDDTLDVFPCHGVGGIVGMIFTAIFATNSLGGFWATGDPTLFLNHMKGLGIVIGFVLVGSFAIYYLVNAIIPIRVKEEQEEMGLDISQHGEKLASL